jgi:hypothetical protein
MLKKALAISLAVIYLAISSGVVVSVHYCMGEVAGMAIGHSDADTCGTCGMDNDGCCHDDVNVVKIQDSHSMASGQVDFVKAETIAQDFSPVYDNPYVLQGLKPIAAAHGPPWAPDRPLHIQYCVFRI